MSPRPSYMETAEYRARRDAWAARLVESAPPLTDRQKVLIRANLSRPTARNDRSAA